MCAYINFARLGAEEISLAALTYFPTKASQNCNNVVFKVHNEIKYSRRAYIKKQLE